MNADAQMMALPSLHWVQIIVATDIEGNYQWRLGILGFVYYA